MRSTLTSFFVGLVVTLLATAAQATPAFFNPNFTSPATTTTFAYGAPITSWFDASGSGSATGISAAVSSSLWDNGVAPFGETNVAFLQNATAALQQTVGGFIVGHQYQIAVIANARAATGSVGLSLGVDGVEVGAQVLTPSPVVAVDPYGVYATSWATYTSQVFTALTVSSLIQIQNQGSSGNNVDVTVLLGSAAINDVTRGEVAAPMPEPAMWAMMVVGFGAVGGVLRRRAVVALG